MFGNIPVLWYPAGQPCIALKRTMRMDETDNGNNVELERSHDRLITSSSNYQVMCCRGLGDVFEGDRSEGDGMAVFKERILAKRNSRIMEFIVSKAITWSFINPLPINPHQIQEIHG
jgi:hypothetical protein